MRTESVILANLIANDDFGRKVIPFLSPEYFHNRPDKIIFQLISDYVGSYNSFPGQDSLLVDLNNKTDISADDFAACDELIRDIVSNKGDNDNVEWLLDTTEKFCQDKAIYNAIMESIKILDDKSGGLSKGSIPKVLSDALGVSFDNSVGHDFIDDAVERFEFYRKKEQRTAFDLDYFNKITNGGLPNKTLNIALAGCVHPNTKVKVRIRKSIGS